DAFIAGVRALQAGNLLDEALAQAQLHLDGLAGDRRTLEVLLQLARAAQRPDLVDRYARALMNFAESRGTERGRMDSLRLAALSGTPAGGVWLTLGAPLHDSSSARFAGTPRIASRLRVMSAVWHGAARGGLLRVADKVPAGAWSDS